MKTSSEYRERLNSLGLPACFFDEHDNPREDLVLSYAAGLIDGEGTIRIAKQGESAMRYTKARVPLYSGSMSMGMVDRKPIELMSILFGGSIRLERATKKNRRNVWRWYITGNQMVLVAIQKIIPYLTVKKPQAELVLDLVLNWHTPRSRMDGLPDWERRRRQDLYWKMRELNSVGSPATTERRSIREDEATVWTALKNAEDSRNDYPATLQVVKK